MGNAKIYWWPYEGGSLQEIDFGESVSDIQERPLRRMVESLTDNGGRTRLLGLAGLEVRIILERFSVLGSSGAALGRKLESLQTHLQKGYPIMFTSDSAKNYLALIDGTIAPAKSVLQTRAGNVLSNVGINGSLTSGDEVWIESDIPEANRELNTYTGISGLLGITLGSSTLYESTRQAWVRYRNFYPALYQPAELGERAIVQYEHRITATLDMTLRLDFQAIAAWEQFYLSGLAGSANVEAGQSLQQQQNINFGSGWKDRAEQAVNIIENSFFWKT